MCYDTNVYSLIIQNKVTYWLLFLHVGACVRSPGHQNTMKRAYKQSIPALDFSLFLILFSNWSEGQ
jgi:hypothetical protein